MKKAFVISGIACIIVGVTALVLLLVFWPPGPDAGVAVGDMDRHFIEQMIPHHEDAVAMAELALERAEHPELKRLAETIIRDQTREIDQMRAWYLSWYEVDAPTDGGAFGDSGMGGGMMGSGMMHDETDLVVLEAAAVFDEEFIQQMIPHHQMAVMMARMVLARTDRAEIEELARSIMSTQTDEIEQMQEWYSTWYE